MPDKKTEVLDYLNGLNEAQHEAVIRTEGPSLVIAGAGSGKTRVLTYRIAHLLKQGARPSSILSLTFTNKAAREMKERISAVVGEKTARYLWMGTFHSVFSKLLRSEHEILGYPANFTIYDSADSKSLIKTIIKDFQLDEKTYKPGTVASRISMAKNNLITPRAYAENGEIIQADKSMRIPAMLQIYKEYTKRCFLSGAMDFDDLLMKTNLLFRDFPVILEKYQQKFDYILVDEYQDTNYSQYLIIKKLAMLHNNICVVGDDAQSIYSFRGARIENILNFRNDYPEHKIFKLEQNYRSTKNIVEAANSVIANNKDQIHKEVWTDNETGLPIKVMKATSDTEEGTMLANAIFEMKMNEQLLNDAFAVLYRTHAQSRSIEEALRRLNIPYKIYGGLSFYSRKEIKDLLAYFRLAINPSDEEALRRIINYPHRGIGETTLQKITYVAAQGNVSLWDIVCNHNSYQLGITGKTAQAIGNFVTLIQSFGAMLNTRSAYDLAEYIAKASGIMKEIDEDKTIEGQARMENIEALLNGIQEFVEREPGPGEDTGEVRHLDYFMQEVALLTDQDSNSKDTTEKVSLMTIHQAKGLEFPYVFIAGMEENLFPSFMSINSRTELEEERRLFYVALTRAEKRATISYAESRYKWGQLTISERSRFVDEIDDRFVEKPARGKWNNLSDEPQQKKALPGFVVKQPKNTNTTSTSPTQQTTPANFKKVGSYQKETASANDGQEYDYDKIQPGMTVHHTSFGAGKVMSVEGIGPNKKALVMFEVVGQKQLLLRFAKLKF